MFALQETIENYFENRQQLSPDNAPHDIVNAVNEVISKLDSGEVRVAEKIDNNCD